MQKELSPVQKKIKQWIKVNKVVDVVIFGSYIRGKTEPGDLDLCILIKDEDEKISLDIVDSLSKILEVIKLKFHINILTLSSFISGNTLAKTLLNEGFSIKYGKNLSSVLGFENKSLFTYTLRHFSPSGRVKFHYLLRGRYGSKGLLKELQGRFLGAGAILIPTEKEDILTEVFDKWDISYNIKRIIFS